MAQRKSKEKVTLEQVLGLADQLTPEEQEQLLDGLKLQWMRRALTQAEKSVEDGRVHTLDAIEARFDTIKSEILERKNKA